MIYSEHQKFLYGLRILLCRSFCHAQIQSMTLLAYIHIILQHIDSFQGVIQAAFLNLYSCLSLHKPKKSNATGVAQVAEDQNGKGQAGIIYEL